MLENWAGKIQRNYVHISRAAWSRQFNWARQARFGMEEANIKYYNLLWDLKITTSSSGASQDLDISYFYMFW